MNPKRIVTILLIATGLSAQTFMDPVLFKKGYSYNNESVLSYYDRTLKSVKIKSINGKTSAVVPYWAQAISGEAVIVKGVPVQYKRTKTGVEIVDVPVKAMSVNFTTGKMTPVDYNSDVTFRPAGYAQLLADELQKPVALSATDPKPVQPKPIIVLIEEEP